MLQFLHELDNDDGIEVCTTDAMNTAAADGHLDIVKWLHENRSEGCTTVALTYAATYGHHEVIKWLFAHTDEGYHACAFNDSASHGDLAMLELLLTKFEDIYDCDGTGSGVGIPQGGFQNWEDDPWNWGHIGDYTFECAIVGNHVEVVEWLCEKFPRLIDVENLRDQAESNQRWGILRWLEDTNSSANHSRQMAGM